jgi:hypothetical protein
VRNEPKAYFASRSPETARQDFGRYPEGTEKGLTAAALDFPALENDLTHAALERTALFVYVSAARIALSLGKLEAAQERIFKARCLTYPK